MSDETYNGWTNYETWTWSLTVLDGDALYERGYEDADMDYYIKTVADMADYLKSEMEEFYSIYSAEIEGNSFESLFSTYTRSGLELIDWRDLAESHFEIYEEGRQARLTELEEVEE